MYMTVTTHIKTRLTPTTVIFMVAVHGVALLAFLPSNFSWSGVGVMLFLHWLTGCLGITLGWHRMLSHRSFQTPKWLEYFLVICGSLACQHGPTDWIGLHRHHHAHSDQEADHHNSNRGFWWSHMEWMLRDIPARSELARFTRDISNDPVYKFCDRYFFPMQIALGALLYSIGGPSWLIWGVFVRLVLVYHCTWFVNSATHKFGYRTFENSGDKSTNCWWVALVTYGEGWHNNHHMYQYSARHGLQWWEIDATWMTISLLKRLGLATNVKLAPAIKN
jgi:sn-1 stearoyl-lipid 9-desaturase